jgi:AhpD family alkylhydroperoxidase
LRVSQINGCAYCLDLHTGALVDRKFSAHKLALVQVWREAGDLFTQRERAALAWAESVTRVVETTVPDHDYVTAKAFFEDKELVDLTLAIGLMNAFNRMAISFRKTPPSIVAI